MKKAIFYLLLFFVIQTMVLIPVMLVHGLVNGGGFNAAQGQVMVVTAVLYSIALVVVFLKCKYWVPNLDFVRSKPFRAIAIVALFTIPYVIVEQGFISLLPEEWVKDDLGEMFESMADDPFCIFALGFFVPIAEEVLFRGAILKALMQWDRINVWQAIIISALFFSLAHMNPAQIPGAFASGLLLGWMFYRTGSILLGCVLHVINNSFAYFLMLAFPELDEDAKMIDFFNGDATLMCSTIAVSAVVLVAGIYLLNKEFGNKLKSEDVEMQSYIK